MTQVEITKIFKRLGNNKAPGAGQIIYTRRPGAIKISYTSPKSEDGEHIQQLFHKS